MCIRDSPAAVRRGAGKAVGDRQRRGGGSLAPAGGDRQAEPVSYTHLRAHETVLDLVCRLLLEKKKIDHLLMPAMIHERLFIFQLLLYVSHDSVTMSR